MYKPFCNTLLTIGICHGQSGCQDRHVLTKFDRSREDIPSNGSVKFEIISCHTPVHFTVRLLEHQAPNKTEWTKIPSAQDFIAFNMELSNYFKDTENHIIHSPCNLGDVCAVGVNLTTGCNYQRAKIIKIMEERYFCFSLIQH